MEREITFDGALVQDLTDARPREVARAADSGTQVLDAVYFDTPDHGLLQRGVTLRRRAGGQDQGWHLKIPGEHGGRREFGWPLGAASNEQVPEGLGNLARAYARGQTLRPVAHLLTHRRRRVWLDADSHPLAEVASDHVAARVLDGHHSGGAPAAELSTWDETEIELTGGGPGLLEDTARHLAERGIFPAERGIKLARALHCAGLDTRPAPPADLAGAGKTARAVVAALRQLTDHLTSLDPAVRLDEEDAVHQMRVTARRLRSLLRACERLWDGHRADDLAADLRWLGHQLGAYREPEALRARLTAQARELPTDCTPGEAERKLRKFLGRRCRHAHRVLVAAMSSRRYYTLLDRLESFVADPPLAAGQHPGSARAARILRRERRRARRRLRMALGLPPGQRRDQALHRARKAAKRTRYVAESLQPILGPEAKHQQSRHQEIHKRLGRHQDARSAEQALADLAHTGGTRPSEAFSLGVLRARQRDSSAADIEAARRSAGL
ncbi:CYTH and CHAD domain-containing protein [Streptacidiphilus jiangxiensis]|uniref:Inorganic triphosphatase YgiF, contains CYTH and CHAD domains n=1 Tax=Streptacidiphilus jiangxiensis TaxID=235985 RepID=A0A1H7NWB3_STRJI|nr:CYTH and CHAD domain-containing protein [Streptacidiphilus jiangxiensis]SEL27706.1 Inorganic triphosphatase YgiF, contains CYTH and CHAD domains [Streptacidiphilus jiangxiensis]